MVALMVAFQAEVHSPLVLTRCVGSVHPRLISVDHTRPTFSLTDEIWRSEIRTMSRLTALPLAMLILTSGIL